MRSLRILGGRTTARVQADAIYDVTLDWAAEQCRGSLHWTQARASTPGPETRAERGLPLDALVRRMDVDQPRHLVRELVVSDPAVRRLLEGRVPRPRR